MEAKKDYSLLKPFDLEAAKRGEKVLDNFNFLVEFVAEGGSDGEHCWRRNSNNLFVATSEEFSMAPLAWVEGKPVYKGDKPYAFEGLYKGKQVTIEGEYSENALAVKSQFSNANVLIDNLTWNLPKVKKEAWINLYKADECSGISYFTSHAFVSKEKADNQADSNRIACIRIEWEE